jgi:hypothetical protein
LFVKKNYDDRLSEQKMCSSFSARLLAEPVILENMLTDDEGWVLQYDQETKRQIHQWKS